MQRLVIPWLGVLVACGKSSGPAIPPSGLHPCAPAECERLCPADPAACARGAERYFWGKHGDPFDLARSFALARRACDAGHRDGCTILGLHHQDGRGTPWDPREAERVYERGCQLGAGTSCYNLATMYAGGHGVTPDPAKFEAYKQQAAAAWQRACDGTERRWCTNAAFALAEADTRAARERRLELNQRACDAGVDVGCTQVAIVKGELGTASDADVLAELERLCTAGEGGACSIAAARLLTGTRVPREPARGVDLFRRACELGEPDGCEALATEELLGEHVPADRAAALRHFAGACDRGVAVACAKLATLHRDAEQPAEQLAYARRACEMNDAPSCATVGAMYLFGTGVAQDQPEGLRWITEACRGGVPEPCGVLVGRGLALPLPEAMQRSMYARLCSAGIAAACGR